MVTQTASLPQLFLILLEHISCLYNDLFYLSVVLNNRKIYSETTLENTSSGLTRMA
jgi:hypothetical protein